MKDSGKGKFMLDRSWKRKRIKAVAFCICVFLAGCGGNGKTADKGKSADANKEYSQDVFAMDTYMSLTAYGPHGKEAVAAAVEEVNRLDSLWSVSSQDGEVYLMNQNGEGQLSEDSKELVKRAQELYESTEGAFDVTVYPIMDLWGFTSGEYHVPAKKELSQTLTQVDQSRITLSGDGKLTLGEKQQIDLGGIAKGYTSNRIMEIYKEYGVTSGMVSLGGNVQALGTKTNGSNWNIGIRNPESQEGDILGVLSISDQAVITSGGYERYFEEDGQTYHHILNPKTGYPADSGLTSVSIVSEDGTLADGLSTALFVMGKEKAISYWQQHKDSFDAVLVEEDGSIYVTEGLEKTFSSDNSFEIVRGEKS